MKYLKRLLFGVCVACRPNRSRTVRLAFPLVFVAATFLGAAALLHKDQSYLRIESSTEFVNAGESFSVDVFAGAHVPVNAVDIKISFSDTQVEVEGIDVGESVITLWAQDPYIKNDEVILQGGTFRRGFVGEHLIATINLEAKESGTARISADEVTFLAGDGSGNEVTVSDSGEDSLTLFVRNTNGSIEGDVKIEITTDIDGDGEVGLDDVNAFMSAWRKKNIVYDFNNDRRMNFTDFAIILSDSFFK